MQPRKRASRWAASLLALVLPSLVWAPAWAQVPTVQRTARGLADKDIQVGIYANILQNCTSGPLPSLRLVSPPTHGNVVVKKAKLNGTNYKQCLALEVPGFVAFYRSAPGFSGTDALVIEVTYPGGRSEIQRITVDVRSTGQVT